MSSHPYWTFFWGTTAGYFVAMYIERTTYKDIFARDHRHKAGTGAAVVGVPTVKKD